MSIPADQRLQTQQRAARKLRSRTGKRQVRLPASVVEARAGLIPSETTDAYPPPDGLIAAELLVWHRGLPVRLPGTRESASGA